MGIAKSFLVFFFFPIIGHCCDCPQNTINPSLEIQMKAAENSECILVGRISNVNVKEQLFDVTVIESLDGIDIQGNRYLGKAWKKCSPFVERNGIWIIYAHTDKDGYLRPTICGISRSFDMYNSIPTKMNQDYATNSDVPFDLLQIEFLNLLGMEIKALRKRKHQLLEKQTIN